MGLTPKAIALGAALRTARTERGMVLREVAALVNHNSGVLSRWENGERVPKPEHVAHLLAKLGVEGDRFDEIMTLAYGTAESTWVATSLPEQRRQMAAFVDWEQSATSIVEVAPLLVPALLQTDDYVRAIMTAGGVPTDEIATRITNRIGRRHVLDKQSPAKFLALLGAATLRQAIGGHDAAVAQARHLLTMARKPNVDIRIIPDGIDWHPALEGAFIVIESDRPALPADYRRLTPSSTATIAFMETRRSVLMLHERRDVDAYRQAIEWILRIALNREDSARYILEVANRLEKMR
jgi:transcriptional regulator with XRE-family HTH domain